jgi:hypothetical protein
MPHGLKISLAVLQNGFREADSVGSASSETIHPTVFPTGIPLSDNEVRARCSHSPR